MLTSIKFISFLLIIVLFGCQQNVADIGAQVQTAPAIEINTETSKDEEKIVSHNFKGTIKLIELEGGFYGIITDKGQKILPMNLNPEYLQDGAEIEFSGHYKNVMTIQQWGKPFTVTEIKLIKAGNKSRHSEI